MASRSRWPSWILLGSVPAFGLRERLMGGLRCFRSRAEPSPRHPPDQHRQPVAAPGWQIGPAHRSLLSLLPRHDASPSIELARVGPRCLREVTHPTAGPLQRFLGREMGGLGPMAGQNHHFSQYAPEKLPYAISRYVNETNRLYGVL